MSQAQQVITLDFQAAVRHLDHFISIRESEKELFAAKLQQAHKAATFKLSQYRAKYGVDMEKEELLRDVVFIGTSLVEASSNNFRYYKAIVKACLVIVEMEAKRSFTQEFIDKLLKAMSSFQCGSGVYFQTDAFYFVFKSHFRLATQEAQ